MKISVILCTYNGASRLPATLEKLAAQDLPLDIHWELILVDNASTDDTPSVAKDAAVAFPVSLRLIHESLPGKHNALRTAFEKASGEYYCVVDDDNLLEPDYLRQGMMFLDQHSDVAIIGGRTFPQFPPGVAVPADFEERYADHLACRDHGAHVIWGAAPPGAGQMGRVNLMRAIYEHIGTWLSDRIGEGVGCCEDLEKTHVCCRLGWQAVHVPQLRLHHVMSSRRLTQGYIESLHCAALNTGPWLRSVTGAENGTSWIHAAKYLVIDCMLVGKYSLLSRLPRLHPKLERAEFWRRYYSSRLAGRIALLQKRKQAAAFLGRIDAAPTTLRPPNHLRAGPKRDQFQPLTQEFQ